MIEKEEELAKNLPAFKGSLYKKIANPKKVNRANRGFKKRYAVVRNKKFKYYKDRAMRDLCGVFDFDRI